MYISPLGESVADLLGLVWRGIYHLSWPVLRRTDWADNRLIAVRIADELATWDFNELTQLVVVSHDMQLRMSITPHGPRCLMLRFWQRQGQYDFDAREGYATHIPSLDDHVEAIRSNYTVVTKEDEAA